MKKFLYLRITAVVTLIIVAVFIILTTYQWRLYDKNNQLAFFWISEALLFVLMSHSILSIAVYNYYPDKTIPKTYLIIYRIAEVGCWICVLVILMGITGIVFLSETDGKSSFKNNYLTVILCFLFLLLLLVQIISGSRLVKTIRENARLELENSFM